MKQVQPLPDCILGSAHFMLNVLLVVIVVTLVVVVVVLFSALSSGRRQSL